MLKEYSPIVQALLGTLFTWALTAAGAGLVVIIRGKQRKLLDISLGFAGGVMVAASYWSLLAPAIEMATESKIYGAEGEYAFIPVGVGFLIGAAFVYGTDVLISSLGIQSPNVLLAMQSVGFYEQNARRRQVTNVHRPSESAEISTVYEDPSNEVKNNQWRRILLLVVAITVHNIPEGLAVGVGFGAIGSSASATFENASSCYFIRASSFGIRPDTAKKASLWYSGPIDLASASRHHCCKRVQQQRQKHQRQPTASLEPSNRNWHSEFSRGSGSFIASSGGRYQHPEEFLVRTAFWYGRTDRWCPWRCGGDVSGTCFTLCISLRCRSHDLCCH
ncbi:zinc transporter ZIP11 isoform X4 [Vespula pensylvanica]|uniref:zinc transporter ZIP11 isoform X4 n=1 Tax=Vespula pensylvanica TaxID=30213 RepID=UPI001CBA3A2F|nr:zinc transporter ZIP11 isoform X4 [Vespula pensylvanica]